MAAVLPMPTPRLAGAGGTTARFLLRGRRWPFFFSAARSHEACFSSGRVACRLHQAGGRVLVVVTADRGVIISRVVSMLDSGAEGPGFKSQSRRCWVIVLWAYYNCDTSTIRLRFDYDSATTRYNTLRGFSFARIRIVYENQW